MDPLKSTPILAFVLTEVSDPQRVRVSLDSFLHFSEAVTQGLEEVVHRWSHRAAPASSLAMIRRGVLPAAGSAVRLPTGHVC